MRETIKHKNGEKNKKSQIGIFLILVVIPLSIWIGTVIFPEKIYAWISLVVAILSCIPIFVHFERKETSNKELIIIAVLITISTLGRFLFAWIPGFKPVTAITVIVAVYLGKEVGFVVGSLSAVASNFYFGQGPWTPFQMFSWGFIGFLAGALAPNLKRKKINLMIYGAFSGVLFSLIMDSWTTLWADGTFNLSRYLAVCVSAIPVTIEYMISNIIFLQLMYKGMGDILERITIKYGLFQEARRSQSYYE